VFLGQLVLALIGRAMDQGDVVFLGPGMNPAAETPGHLHQVVRIQGCIRSGQCSPPGTESPTLLAEGKVAIEYDAIDAILTALEEFLVIRRQVIGLFHRKNLRANRKIPFMLRPL
jgi:hypothetical protein